MAIAFSMLTVSGSAPSQPSGASQEEAEDATAKWTPEFENDSYSKTFTKARELYDKRSFKKAGSSFKKTRRGAASDEDVKKIDAWMLACKGGLVLHTIARRVKLGRQRDAFFALLDEQRKYHNTPIAESFKNAVSSLASKVVKVIDDFERKDSRLKESFGMNYVRQPNFSYQGESCLQWAQTKDRESVPLRRANGEANWKSYDGVVFWMRADAAAPMEIIARCKGKDKKQLNAYMTKYAARNSRDWVRVYLPMKQFKKYGQANLAQVENVILQIQKGKYFKVYVDYICLVRKDPGERRN